MSIIIRNTLENLTFTSNSSHQWRYIDQDINLWNLFILFILILYSSTIFYKTILGIGQALAFLFFQHGVQFVCQVGEHVADVV